jgi:hypothetical protein
MELSTGILLISVPVLIVATYFVRKQKKSPRWGTCPSCGGRLPEPDPAADGWTCTWCGCEVDKHGRERGG